MTMMLEITERIGHWHAMNIRGLEQDISFQQVVSPGDSVELQCHTDSAWEFCFWRHSEKDETGEETVRECHMEWKWVKASLDFDKMGSKCLDCLVLSVQRLGSTVWGNVIQSSSSLCR